MSYLVYIIGALGLGGFGLFQFLRNKNMQGLLKNANVEQAVEKIAAAEGINTDLINQAATVVTALEQKSTATVNQNGESLETISSNINSIITPPTK